MAIPKDIETTDDPIDLKGLKILIDENGYKVDMVLQYNTEKIPIKGVVKKGKNKFKIEGSFHIFARYHQSQIIRQIFTQRHQPRKFKNLERALSWGKETGFRKVLLAVDLEDYVAPDDIVLQ